MKLYFRLTEKHLLMRISLFMLNFVLTVSGLFCQNFSDVQINEEKHFFNEADKIRFLQLPQAVLPDFLKNRDLPSIINNDSLPYFRPVFNQSGSSCGQSAGVGYNFTYEINRARQLPADTNINQYPTHFVYNFMSGGSGYFGVNYMHSFEILRTLGTPNVAEFGGMSNDGETWISGYDFYYSAMKNRIREVRNIRVDNPEGLLTLKHWLVNHLEGAATGGIANFNAGSPWNLSSLPPGSPEAGKKVIANFAQTYATHAMTIVGYNDSIRYDYNNDGQYTNYIDINNDGEIDMRDWEIGGVRFANSYGNSWADEGFCYMMYKVLADDVTEGGIWNGTVTILDVKGTYEPLLTMKLVVKHDSRKKIRISAGVATDTSDMKPDHHLFFPVFNYQGGHKYMQGGREDESKKTIEIGLDLTPLLTYTLPGQPAKFFVEINENDPQNEGSGEIISFGLVDYTSGITIIPCANTNQPLQNNQTTRLSVIHTLQFNPPVITTAQLPTVSPNQPCQQQMTVSGGTPDYRWHLKTPYYQQQFESVFPVIEQKELIPEAPHFKYATQEIEFEFPFYGEKFSTLYIHQNGFILFGEDIYPWPYYNDGYLLFREMKNIAAFLFYPVEYYNGTKGAEGIWYEGNENYAAFRWKKPLMHHTHTAGYGEFAVKLYPDGTIEYFFNGFELDEDILWYSGVSEGKNKDHTLIDNSNSIQLPGFNAIRLVPELIPDSFTLTSTGFLSGFPEPSQKIHHLTFEVTDDKEISAEKTLQLSDAITFEYSVYSGENSPVQSGETARMDITLKNISSTVLNNVTIHISSNNPYLAVITGTVTAGNIQPGEEITLNEAFEMFVSAQCPDQYSFLPVLEIQSDTILREGIIPFTTQAPVLAIKNIFVDDQDNHRIDPGETAELLLTIINEGTSKALSVTGLLTSDDPFITVLTVVPKPYGNIQPGAYQQNTFTVSADVSCPISHVAKFDFLIETENGVQVFDSFNLTIGQHPLLIVNLAKNENSVSVIKNTLNIINIPYLFQDSLPKQPELYRAMILCLGTFYGNTALTQDEGQLLAHYLDQGGKLYMEGTTTWYIDPQTAVHPRFRTAIITVPNWYNFTTLNGLAGTFAEGLSFDFTGTYNLLPCYFQPADSAFPVMRADEYQEIYTMTACETSTYKTVGSLLEFGSFGNENANEERKILLTGIIEFFGLQNYISSAPDQFDHSENLLIVQPMPNPFTDIVNLNILTNQTGNFVISIFNINGEPVGQSKTFHFLTGEQNPVKLDLSKEAGINLPAGIYFYRIISGSNTANGKLIKIK